MRNLILAALSLLALPAFATEGGVFADASFGSTPAFYLCDGDHTAAAPCAEIDLRSLAGNTKQAPSTIQFGVVRASTNCTPTVTIYGRFITTALAETAGMDGTDHEIIALEVLPGITGTGTSSMSPAVPTLFRVYYATVSSDADCADLEIVVLLHNAK